MAPAIDSPFDILAEHAIKEYQEGHTKTVEKFAQEHDVSL